MVREIKIMGDKTRVGRHDGRIQKMLYEKVVLPTITYNMESTTNMTNKEMEDMEMIQGKMLRKIYKVPPSTPYWGLLIELGMKPIEYIIHSKRLMLYHNIINTKTKRLSKDIIEQQMIYQIKGGFYEEIQKSKVFFEIGIESKTLEKMKKSTWKAIIKEKSEERMNREIQQKTTTMKKLRFLRGTHANESQYVKYCSMEETTKLLRLRLNMIKFDSNYGKRGTCKICQKVAETMEHMLECKEANVEYKQWR